MDRKEARDILTTRIDLGEEFARKGFTVYEGLIEATRMGAEALAALDELEKLCGEWLKTAQENAGYKGWYGGHSVALRFCAADIRRLLKKQTPKLRPLNEDE